MLMQENFLIKKTKHIVRSPDEIFAWAEKFLRSSDFLLSR